MAEAIHSVRGIDGRDDTFGFGEERLTGTVRPTSVGEGSVSGRDERPGSSADAIERLEGLCKRGWLKPSTP